MNIICTEFTAILSSAILANRELHKIILFWSAYNTSCDFFTSPVYLYKRETCNGHISYISEIE